MLELSGGETIG